MQAIETVFNEALGLQYTYEPEPFSLQLHLGDCSCGGERQSHFDSYETCWAHGASGAADCKRVGYLPDFWLSDFNAYVEIKPLLTTSEESCEHYHFGCEKVTSQFHRAYERCMLLSKVTNRVAMLVCGDPWPLRHHVTMCNWQEHEMGDMPTAIRRADSSEWIQFTHVFEDLNFRPEATRIERAYLAARQERFGS